MGKEGRESEQARALTNWKADGRAVRMGGNGARKSTHLWMSKSGREGIGASEWHSPMDGQVREGGNWSKQEHSPMDEQVRGGGNQSKQVALTYGWASQGGRESEQASKQHSPKDDQGRKGSEQARALT